MLITFRRLQMIIFVVLRSMAWNTVNYSMVYRKAISIFSCNEPPI